MQHVLYRLQFSKYFTLLLIDNTRPIALWRSFWSKEYQPWNDSCPWNLIPTYQLLIMTNEPHAESVLLCTSTRNYLCFISGIISIFAYESKYSVIFLKGLSRIAEDSVPANKFIIIHTLVETTPIKGII